jgi:hypothetical protein
MRFLILPIVFSLCTSSLFAGHVTFYGALTNTGGASAGAYLTNGDSARFWFDYVGANASTINLTGYSPIPAGSFTVQSFFAEGSHQDAGPFTWQGIKYTARVTNNAAPATLTYSSSASTATGSINFTQTGGTSTFLPNYLGNQVTLSVQLSAVGTGQAPYDGSNLATEENLHKLFISSAVSGTVEVSYFDIGTSSTVVVDSATFSGLSRVPEPATWGLFAALGGVFCVRQYRRFKK